MILNLDLELVNPVNAVWDGETFEGGDLAVAALRDESEVASIVLFIGEISEEVETELKGLKASSESGVMSLDEKVVLDEDLESVEVLSLSVELAVLELPSSEGSLEVVKRSLLIEVEGSARE